MIPTVSLKYCEFDAKRKVLKLASEFFGVPPQLFIQSHHTGRVVRFEVMGENDPLFDPDQWDGEQTLYRPARGERRTNVDHLVIYHAY
jgi:hypothetical protein